MILLIENPTHHGIALISAAYKRAFEYLGIDFHFLSFRKEPQSSIDEINSITQNVINNYNTDKIIVIQPTFFTGQTYIKAMMLKKKGIKFYCINTEDPYSISGLLQIHNLFDIKFTNEKLVADKFANLNFKYLPVAFDSLMPYKHSTEKEYDICSIMTYYDERMKWYKEIPKGLKVFAAGSISPLIRDAKESVIDIAGMCPVMIRRHKEYEYYSKSKFVLNPHRDPSIVGRHYLNLMEGQPCQYMFKTAISPNPRFFDAIGCGAIPLNDESRAECFEILRKHSINESMNIFKLSYLTNSELIQENIIAMELRRSFMEKETYLNRAEQVLNAIECE